MQVIPAILTASPQVVQKNIRLLEGTTSVFHIDFADGVFVKTTSVQPDIFFQIQTRVHLEAHLMIQDVIETLPLYLKYFSPILLHIEVPNTLENLKRIEDAGVKCGVAINPDTPLEKLTRYARVTSRIHVLSVFPGYQGRQFLPETLQRLLDLRREFPNIIISCDGGINRENVELVKDAGVDIAVVGSAIYQSNNPRSEFLELTRIIA